LGLGFLIRIMPAMARKTQSPPKTFEDALSELEQILADMEGGQVALEESLAKYERGSFLIRHCREVLSTAEKQIEVLSKNADSGIAVETIQPQDIQSQSTRSAGTKSEPPAQEQSE